MDVIICHNSEPCLHVLSASIKLINWKIQSTTVIWNGLDMYYIYDLLSVTVMNICATARVAIRES